MMIKVYMAEEPTDGEAPVKKKKKSGKKGK